jgi:uncharacterized protein (TIGR02118 family)
VIRLIFCLRRLPTLSRAEFQRYWRETHAPLVAERAGTLRIARYVQHHTLDEAAWRPLLGPRAVGDPFDGVAELAWESEAALRGDPADAAARQAGGELLADERNFIDLPRSPIFVVRSDVIVG